MWEYIVIKPLTFIIELIYSLVQNYGWTIIWFTIIVKLILLPLNIRSQKAMKKTQKIQPYLAELQKKYANDKEKLSMETMKLYRENNVSMTGGCLPLLIQMPILVGLYQVIRNMSENPEINFNFLGLNLEKIPSAALKPIMSGNFSDLGTVLLILIPILAILSSWLSTKTMQSQQQAKTESAEQAAQMTNSMNLMMPIMTGFFTLTLPAGMGLYWIASNVVQIVQQVVLNKILDEKEDEINVIIPEKNRKKRKK